MNWKESDCDYQAKTITLSKNEMLFFFSEDIKIEFMIKTCNIYNQKKGSSELERKLNHLTYSISRFFI